MMSHIVNNSRDTVNFSSLKEEYAAGDELVLNCTISACQLSPVIATNVISYLKRNNSTINSSVFNIKNNSYCKFSLAVLFTNVNLSNAGKYICSYSLSGSSFFQLSDVKYNATNVTVRS